MEKTLGDMYCTYIFCCGFFMWQVCTEAHLINYHYVSFQPMASVAAVGSSRSSPACKPTCNNIQNQVLVSSDNIGKGGNCDDLAPNASANVIDATMRSRVLAPETVKK